MGASSHLGWRSKVDVYHGDKTVSFMTENSGRVQMHELSKSVLERYYAHPLLFNGHLQTFWTVATKADIPVWYARRIMTGQDGGTFAVDFVTQPSDEQAEGLPERTRFLTKHELETQGSDDTKPMIISLHGLSGGSHELYLRAVLAPLVEQGWEGCVVNSRGCANSKITTHQLFNARWTNDVREVVKFLRKIYPNRPFYAVGFSLGANILTNYLGEEGEKVDIRAAAVCSSPWKLEVSSMALNRTFIGREIYSRVMGTNLKKLVDAHKDVLKEDPKLDLEKVMNTTYLWEFDRDLTAKVFGYPTVGAYYRDASSVDKLLNVRTPTFILHALDDPVTAHECIPFDEVRANPYAFMATTTIGGHLSWFEPDGERWFARMVVKFFAKFQGEVQTVEKPDLKPWLKSKL